MNVQEDNGSESRVMTPNKNGGSRAASKSDDATDYGLQRMLGLPTELRFYILELLIIDKRFDAYCMLLEHPEIGGLVRCNFNAQFKAVKRHHYLASQLQQILKTTALLQLMRITYTRVVGWLNFWKATSLLRSYSYAWIAPPRLLPSSRNIKHAWTIRIPLRTSSLRWR